jgi:hypothetical protein
MGRDHPDGNPVNPQTFTDKISVSATLGAKISAAYLAGSGSAGAFPRAAYQTMGGDPMTPSSRQATLIAVFYVLLVAAIAVIALLEYEVDDFLKVWAVLGTLVGVLTGAIPAYFFAAAAGTAQRERARMEDKAQTLLGLADSELLSQAASLRPDLFGKFKTPEKN